MRAAESGEAAAATAADAAETWEARTRTASVSFFQTSNCGTLGQASAAATQPTHTRPTCRWRAAVAACREGGRCGGAVPALLLLHGTAGRTRHQVCVLEDALQEVVGDLRGGHRGGEWMWVAGHTREGTCCRRAVRQAVHRGKPTP